MVNSRRPAITESKSFVMDPNNPLLVYRSWFLDLELDIADLLALEIFKNLSQFHPPGSDLRTIFESKNENPIYSGLEAGKLIDLIDALVQANEKFTNQRTAVILLSVTTFFMQAIKTDISQNSKKERQKLFKSVITGDRAATEHWENKLSEKGQIHRSKVKIWKSWITLVENRFTYHAIHSYLIRS